jgi:hypothetical protein
MQMKRLTAASTSSNSHFVTSVTMDLERRKTSAAIDVASNDEIRAHTVSFPYRI